MTVEEILLQLEALGNEKVRAQNAKRGAGDNQFGVRLGDLRNVAEKLKTDHDLALALWETGNLDARFLATLIIKPKTSPPRRWTGWCGPSTSSGWPIGSTPTS